MTADTPPSPHDAAAAAERGRPVLALLAGAGARLAAGRKLRDNEVALLAMSGLFGIAIGAAVVAIERLVQLLHQVNFAVAANQHLSAGGALDWWRVALVPIVGGLLAGSAQALLRRARTHEVVDAVEANALFGGKMSLTDSIGLTLLLRRGDLRTVVGCGAAAAIAAAFNAPLAGAFYAFELVIGNYSPS